MPTTAYNRAKKVNILISVLLRKAMDWRMKDKVNQSESAVGSCLPSISILQDIPDEIMVLVERRKVVMAAAGDPDQRGPRRVQRL